MCRRIGEAAHSTGRRKELNFWRIWHRDGESGCASLRMKKSRSAHGVTPGDVSADFFPTNHLLNHESVHAFISLQYVISFYLKFCASPLRFLVPYLCNFHIFCNICLPCVSFWIKVDWALAGKHTAVCLCGGQWLTNRWLYCTQQTAIWQNTLQRGRWCVCLCMCSWFVCVRESEEDGDWELRSDFRSKRQSEPRMNVLKYSSH